MNCGEDKMVAEYKTAKWSINILRMADPVDGKYAVVINRGWCALEGWYEVDYEFFGTLREAKAYALKELPQYREWMANYVARGGE